MPSVTLKDLVKEYEGGIRVVERVSLEIADREFVVLVGPSGCDKSTTLRMIAGLEEITSGSIAIGGMTVFENMGFALKLRRLGGPRQRVALGRAIVRDPQCFLFDEPLSNLAAKLRVEMRAELARARALPADFRRAAVL